YFGLLLAMVLQPMIAKFRQWRIPGIMAIILSLIISTIIVFGILYVLVTQVSNFMKDWPQLEKNFEIFIEKSNKWLAENFHLKRNFLSQKVKQFGSGGNDDFVTTALFSITDILNNLLLVPLYAFLILYYRKLLMKFLIDISELDHTPRIIQVIGAAKQVITSYIMGLLMEMIIVTCLNTLGLWLVGAKYFVLIAVMAAILNLIPYIGMLIAGIIGVLITMSYTQNISIPLGIIGVLGVVQILDNNLIFPAIVGGKVKLNSLFSVLGVFVGGYLGGIAGMFLSIPTLAIMKVTFDKIPHLQPWGMVLGDDIPIKYLSWKHMAKLWKSNNPGTPQVIITPPTSEVTAPPAETQEIIVK
ncbi:MAG: hypothetical protein JWQ78_2118, partial [Sediminibacterium sp.]|nr:hypothetical protein [Sediminibacterium sp.]